MALDNCVTSEANAVDACAKHSKNYVVANLVDIEHGFSTVINRRHC
jgi:hypothetical protein